MATTNDMLFVLGIIVTGLSVLLIVRALMTGTPIRIGALLAIVGTVLVFVAMTRHPVGYDVGDVVPAFRRVFRDVVYQPAKSAADDLLDCCLIIPTREEMS